MKKLIKLEYSKYLKSINLIIGLGYCIAALVFEMIFFDIDISDASIIGAVMGVIDFHHRFNVELKNGLGKISLITPMGRKKVVMAKIIVSVINGAIYSIFSIGVVMMSYSASNKGINIKEVLVYFMVAIMVIIFVIKCQLIDSAKEKIFWAITYVLIFCRGAKAFFGVCKY